MSRKPGGGGGNATRFSGRSLTTRVKSAKRRTTSSKRWLERQLNDPYVAEAKARGYRSRAAFKLLELDKTFRLLKKGGRVVDLGAAPGGWTQVATAAVGPGGHVVAIDIQGMDPVPGAIVIHRDFLDDKAPAEIIAALDGPADLVLSDMAAPATGHRQTDHLRIMGLCEAAADFACRVLAPGGAFVAKVLKGGTENELLAHLKQRFAQVKHAKPPASRSDSAEAYVVATGFRPEPDTE